MSQFCPTTAQAFPSSSTCRFWRPVKLQQKREKKREKFKNKTTTMWKFWNLCVNKKQNSQISWYQLIILSSFPHFVKNDKHLIIMKFGESDGRINKKAKGKPFVERSSTKVLSFLNYLKSHFLLRTPSQCQSFRETKISEIDRKSTRLNSSH